MCHLQYIQLRFAIHFSCILCVKAFVIKMLIMYEWRIRMQEQIVRLIDCNCTWISFHDLLQNCKTTWNVYMATLNGMKLELEKWLSFEVLLLPRIYCRSNENWYKNSIVSITIYRSCSNSNVLFRVDSMRSILILSVKQYHNSLKCKWFRITNTERHKSVNERQRAKLFRMLLSVISNLECFTLKSIR